MKTFRLSLIALLGLLSIGALHGQVLDNIGNVAGGTSSQAFGINDSDQVVGFSTTSSGNNVAFIYSNGTMTSLGTLGGTASYAYAINDSGEMVGQSTATLASTYYPFVDSNGVMTNLGAKYGAGQANAINNSGQVAGSYGSGGFLYTSSSSTNLGYFIPQAINNSAEMAGYTSVGFQVAAVYSNGTTTSLPSLGGNVSQATGINNLGQVVGYGDNASGNDVAFLSSAGKMTNLGSLGGTLGSFASGINDSGLVVGASFTSGSGGEHAFIYSSIAGMQDLNTVYAPMLVSGFGSQVGFTDLISATAINQTGDIVGYGDYWNGSSTSVEGFLLDVPEPSTWAMLLGGLGLLAFVRFRR